MILNMTELSEHSIMNNNDVLIVCFGGYWHQFGGILPFEFCRYLSSIYTNQCDLLFYVDYHQCSYQKGIKGITNSVNETVTYLNNKINKANYNKVIFMGTSAGGYAAILFGSLCENIHNVVSFIPQTIVYSQNPHHANLKHIINNNTLYTLYGDTSITELSDAHHIRHCENINNHANVTIIKIHGCDLKQMRDNGTIKNILDNIMTTGVVP
jgi:hypothetical protein